jgi:CheY-like chemotaxis protein
LSFSLNQDKDCPYAFEVDVALSAAECVEKVRSKSYDVIVLDVHMETATSGLKANMALAMSEEFGSEKPVRIILTGYPEFLACVEAMRYGAWDYIAKQDVGGKRVGKIVVDSTVARLRQLDIRREQEQQIAANWLPQHFRELQKDWGGQLIALWHRSGTKVIASGRDAFDLEANLKEWRGQHAIWEQPFIVQLPPLHGEDE